MLRWCLLEETEHKGVIDGELTVFPSGRAAIDAAEKLWDSKYVSFFVGLFNVDENGHYFEDENGNVDADCRAVLRDWLSPIEENRMKRILNASGLNITAFSKTFGIPYRSIQNWLLGEREAPDYLLDMLEQTVWMNKDNV